jgi:hypothetical protein
MERCEPGTEAPACLALAEPASHTPALFVDMAPRATSRPVLNFGTSDFVVLRAQGSHGITGGGAEIGGISGRAPLKYRRLPSVPKL